MVFLYILQESLAISLKLFESILYLLFKPNTQTLCWIYVALILSPDLKVSKNQEIVYALQKSM